jgi:RNA polymerase sigma factor (sigma-70 family)
VVNPSFQRYRTCGAVVIEMSSKSSVETVEAVKPSLAAVFEEEEAPLVRYASGLVGRREVAEELVQDAFLRLHQHWETVEKPRPWLYRCVRNRSLDHLRHNKREYLSDELPEPDRERRREPDEELERLETAGLLRMLMDELNERDRELIRLRYFEDLKYAGISERTGMTIGNVGCRLHHILKNLAESLRRVGVEGGQSRMMIDLVENCMPGSSPRSRPG